MAAAEVLVDIKELEKLLPKKRILDEDDLSKFGNFLYRLLGQVLRDRGTSQDLKDKILALENYFEHYLVHDPGPHRISKDLVIQKIEALLPSVD